MSERDRLAGVTELSAWIASREDEPGEVPVTPAGGVRHEQPPEPVDEESARSIALRALGRRAASRQELDRTLERREVEPEVREAVLDRLADEGLVDDAQLAQDLAERLRERKHLGERGIAAELRKRGLDPDAIERSEADDELQRAIDAAAERRRRLGSLDDETAERRLAGWLQRRGFGGSTVRTAIERTRARGPRFR
ncbi:regulatory protein RecX [Agrococcus baldri]|uniref:Regulatory protein RecX n=1 Tax=Agrococcus baldri TaxID=153730 RepID=A0AA87RE91_9MICO|nr:regulatory protein RecX [Agrococcus baldri]GEK81082.1 regulatory protein RecX [Agrococcus baldri]